MLLPLNLLALTLSLLPSVRAVFADEAYNIDYHHELLGLPQPHTTFFHRPRKDEKATLLYTLSDLGVLGAVHPGTGKVIWRQAIGDGQYQAYLRGVEGEGTVVSAARNAVQAWDAMTGRERWGNAFSGVVKDLEIMESVAGGDDAKDILVLFEESGKGLLRKLKGASGDVVWEYRDTSEDMLLQVSTNVEHVFIVSLHGAVGAYNVKVTTLDPVTGKKTNEYVLSAKADVIAPEDILLVGANSAAPIVAWTDKALKNLKVNILGKAGSLQSLPLKDTYGEIVKIEVHAPTLVQSLPHFLVHSHSVLSNRADVYHIDLKTGNIKAEYELPNLSGKGAISVSSQNANVYFTRTTEDEIIIVSSVSHGVLGRWPIQKGTDLFLHGTSEVVQRTGDTYAVRSALLTNKEEWVLIRNGAVDWSRPEGLAGAVAAEWAEIPESETLAKTLEAEAHSNPLSAYIHRCKRHIGDLQYLPAYLEALPRRLLSSILPVEIVNQKPGVLVRDTFGFNKLVILATQRGRVYGLDAGNQGAVAWSADAFTIPAGKKWDIKGLWVDPSKGIATIRGSDGEYVIVQVATGKVVEKMYPGSWPSAQSTAVVDTPSGRWMLTIGNDGNPGEVPVEWAPKEILVVQGNDGGVKGVRFEAAGVNAQPTIAWSFQPPSGQKVVKVTARPAHDPVASIGRVLGDRRVLYKYLNPNIVLVTAVSEEASTASFYLIDSVAGDLLYSTTHEGVDTLQPVTSVLTENWFAYSLWSDVVSSTTTLPSSKGYQIVISDLYESSVPNDRGPLGPAMNSSSLEPSDIPNAEPAIPYVITQSFLIPESISHMSVTQTRQGITTRQLLCTLASSNSIIGIPRAVLDPRRPVGRDPTPAEVEEGLFKYQPYIEFDPKIIISHKREVMGVKKVITTAALLESTSLVFAFGLDIFGTRVAPSFAFDILGMGFNKLSLVGTVFALWVGVVVVAPMVRFFPCASA
jgi:outer membrane protein assembly factor BamB